MDFVPNSVSEIGASANNFYISLLGFTRLDQKNSDIRERLEVSYGWIDSIIPTELEKSFGRMERSYPPKLVTHKGDKM